MKVQTYNPNTLLLDQDSVTGVDFGTVFQGNHCEEVVIVRPQTTTEANFLQLKMFLQDQGGFTQTEFGHYQNEVLTGGITPGSPYLSDNFALTTNPQITGDGVDFNASNPEYLWLDAETGDREKGSSDTVNYRFVFEYN